MTPHLLAKIEGKKLKVALMICKIQVTNATFVFVNNWFFTNIGLL